MTQTVHVKYAKTHANTTLEGGISIEIPDTDDAVVAFGMLYEEVKSEVDNRLALQPTATTVSYETQTIASGPTLSEIEEVTGGTAVLPPKNLHVYDGSERLEDVKENEPVRVDGARVFNVEESTTARGTRKATVRIGAKDKIPMGYVNAKSFEPSMVSTLLALKEGDIVSINGYFEGWKGNEDRPKPMYDLMVQHVQKAGSLSRT